MYPVTRWECCQRPHQLLRLKRVAAHGPCLGSDCGCVPDYYAQLARSCCFVASYNGGPMMADSLCRGSLGQRRGPVGPPTPPRVSGCGSPVVEGRAMIDEGRVGRGIRPALNLF